MLLLPLWIFVAYCAISSVNGDSDESVEKQEHQRTGSYSRQQSGGFVPHSNKPTPVYGWNPQLSAGHGYQGYNNPQAQGSGGYGHQPFPAQSGQNGYQGPSGYGFPTTGGYSPNMPYQHQTQPNFPSPGIHNGFGSPRSFGYHNQDSHHAHFGQQSPYPYGGQQPNSRFHSHGSNFGPQLPFGGHHSNSGYNSPHGSNFGPQPSHGGYGPPQEDSGWNFPTTPPNFGSHDPQPPNRVPGLQAATGGYGPNAIIHHSTGESSELHASRPATVGLQSATGGFGPDAIDPSSFDDKEFGRSH